MTTRPASGISEFSDVSIERIAYSSVEEIPVLEQNDRNRLGYHVWLYLSGKAPSLPDAFHAAKARILIDENEALTIIAKNLQGAGPAAAG